MPKRQRQTSGDTAGPSNSNTKTWFDESSSSDSDGSADSKESVDSEDYKKAAYRRWGIDSPQHFMGAFESESDSDSDESDSDSDEEPEEEEPSFLHITNEQLIARQQRQDQLRIAKMGAFHPSWHHPLDPSKGKRGTSSSTEQGNALSYLVIRAENTESPVPTVKKITGEFVARIPDHCFEELRAEASAESGWRRDPAHMGYGLPMRKFDASDLEKEEKKNNRPIQMLYYKDEEKKGYNVYFSGWTCQTTLFNKGKAFQRLEVFPRAQLRTMFIMKLFGNRVDKMQVEAAQDPDHLFWLLEDMSHIHTMANKGYGDGFVYYMTTDSEMPRLPIYKYTPIAIVTNKTYEHCARSRFSKSFETLKTDSKKQWETRMGGICENPRGCVCENRYEMLFGGDGGVHQLRYQEDASGNPVLNFKDHKVEKAAMIVECSDACGCSRNCPRRCVQKRTAFKLVVLYLSPDVGNGLFSAIPIAAGSFIIEYVGLLRMVDEAEDDDQSYKASASNILPEVIIDSLTIGNVSRFVNYSSSPNAFLLQVFSRKSEEEVLVPRIAIFAAQDIEYGEQITIPWPKSQTPAKQARQEPVRLNEQTCEEMAIEKAFSLKKIKEEPDNAKEPCNVTPILETNDTLGPKISVNELVKMESDPSGQVVEEKIDLSMIKREIETESVTNVAGFRKSEEEVLVPRIAIEKAFSMKKIKEEPDNAKEPCNVTPIFETNDTLGPKMSVNELVKMESDPSHPVPREVIDSHTDRSRDEKAREEATAMKKRLLALHRETMDSPHADIFKKPVPASEIEYGQVVKEKIDLSMIKREIETESVTNVAGFLNRTYHMLANAIMYNGAEHEVSKMASALVKTVNKFPVTPPVEQRSRQQGTVRHPSGNRAPSETDSSAV